MRNKIFKEFFYYVFLVLFLVFIFFLIGILEKDALDNIKPVETLASSWSLNNG